jgi:hypothetical protein
MPQQHHIVKRQILELVVSRDQDTHRLHETLSHICRSRLTPILDKHCSALSDTDVIYRVDTLELDLGKIPCELLQEALGESFEKALGIKLAKAIATEQTLGEPGATVSRLAPVALYSRPQRGTTTVPAAATMGEEVQAKVASQLELLAYYVNTGTLPWWAEVSRAGLLEDNLKLLVEQAPSPLRRVVRDFSRDDRALRRMALTYDDTLLELTLGVLVPALQAPLRHFAPGLAEILARTNAARDWARSRIRNLVWEDVLRLAGSENVETISPAEFSRSILHRLARRFGVGWRLFSEDLHRTLETGSTGDYTWLADLAASLQESPAASASPGTKPAPQPDDLRLSAVLRESSVASDAAPDVKLPRFVRLTAPISLEVNPAVDLRFSDSDEVYVTNAGLVILWPFLEHFFKHVGLVEEKHFKDDAARQRAAGLLQYVASEDESPPEYLLPLNKVLCGLDADEVFDFGPPITELEIHECGNFLTCVIAQVPILHDMSLPGFRGTFLLRQGQLSTRDGVWLLRVERETYDVVLDRFPWTISWVKLPWMQGPIQVEW